METFCSFTVFILLLLDPSRQQESSETLNETLDKLIKQTELVKVSENDIAHRATDNNSRIYFLHPPGNHNKTGNEILKSMSSIINDPDKLISMTDILQALGLSGDLKSGDDSDHNIGKGKIIKEVTVTLETNHESSNSGSEEIQEDLTSKSGNPTDLQTVLSDANLGDTKSESDSDHYVGTGDITEEKAKENNHGHESNTSSSEEGRAHLSSKGGHPDDVTVNSDNALLAFAGENKNSLLHKYPQIIIDRITPHSNNKTPEQSFVKKPVEKPQNLLDEINKYPDIAKELKSLLDELHTLKAAEALARAENADHARSMSQSKDTHNHNVYRCNNPLKPYSAPCESLLLNKFQHTHGSIGRTGDPHLHSNLHLTRWGAGNPRHDALMRISRAHKLKRIQFITELINNMMSRFVYRPLYGYL